MDSTAQDQTIQFPLVYKYVPFLSMIVVLLLSGTVLIGWVANIPVFTRVLPAFSAMNPLTAIAFSFLGCSFLAFFAREKSKLLVYISVILAALVMVIMSAHIFQLVAVGDSIIDVLILRDKVISPGQPPARTAFSTAVSFVLLAGGVITLPLSERFRSTILNQLLVVMALSISFMALVFYLTQQVAFFEIPFFFGMAVNTAFSFFLLSLGLLLFLRGRFKAKIILTGTKFIIGFLVTFLIVWFSYIVPELTKLSNTFSYKASIFSTDNFYDVENEQFSGEVISDTTFSYEVINQFGRVIEIKNLFDVRKPNGEPIFSVERVYGINQVTGKHVAGFGDKDRTGYLFGPHNATKQDFTYWHINYDEPAEMKFVEEEDLFGLTTYKYEARYSADQTQELDNLPEVGETKGIDLDIYLQLWIDPQTGRMIKYQDETEAYYYDLATGERLYPWNTFSNRFTTPAIENQVALAKEQLQANLFVVYVVPLFVSIIIVFFIIAYFIDTVSSANSLIFLPYAIFILGLTFSILLWYFVRQNTINDAKAKFDSETDGITHAIVDKMSSYDLALQSTRGLLQASEEVNREEWQLYVKNLNISINFSGVQGVGYALVLQADEIDSHVAAIKAEGFSDYSVRPLEPERDVYTAIVYLEPFDFRNQRAFGFDMFSEVTRRTAMARARDTGETAVSGRVILLQETDQDVQPGFLMYIPYYEEKVLPTIEDRQAAIAGYVYSPFRASDLMKSTFLNTQYQIYLEVLDGSNPEASYEDNGLYRASLSGDEEVDVTSYKPRFSSSKQIDVYGRDWTLKFYAEPNYSVNRLQEASPMILLFGGFIFTGLVTYAVNLLLFSRSSALKLANTMTKDLQQKTALLDESNKVLSSEIEERKKAEDVLKKKTIELERVNKLMIGRELKMVELKKKVADV